MKLINNFVCFLYEIYRSELSSKNMEFTLRGVSLSHQRAPVDVRELFYLTEPQCESLLLQFQEILGIKEALLFSTCNRTELFYVSDHNEFEAIVRLLCIQKGLSDHFPTYFTYFTNFSTEEESIRYLFEVSVGLQSQLLGDLQISSQVKQAYSLSHRAGMANAYLHRLMHTIFHAGKRVQQETMFRDGAVSVSYATAQLAAELAAGLAHPRILIVGLGEMGSDVAKSIDTSVFSTIYLSNRTLSKAISLAEALEATAIDYKDIPDMLTGVDIVVMAVSVSEPVFMPDWISQNRLDPLFIIDLCVPRSVSPEIENLPKVISYNIDEIRLRTEEALSRRRASIPTVQAILQEEIQGFLTWKSELVLTPAIHKMKEALEQIRKEELARYLRKATTEKETRLIEDITQSMIHKLLRLPILQLKAACRRGDPENLIGLINELFDIEKARDKMKNESDG